ncbi:MAG TPA: hypothetical protein DCZ94_00355 [Lentisphaeria bacterium]|nr:MAG: hypothetical protein A2X48_18850 [Lentisphaerae bacterium GWF2_49_21]HBC85382.1 hypothetical protein [Lentisphaeria bacterium]
MKLKMLMAAVTMLAVTGAYAQFGIEVPGFKKEAKKEAKKEEAKKDDAKVAGASTALPFGVKLGGQQAAAKGDASFATVEQPVADNAELEVAVEKPEMVIINVFPADEKGNVKQGAAAIIIMFQKTNKGTIDQTIDKKKIPAGTYLMNIVAGEKTSRVVFKIK